MRLKILTLILMIFFLILISTIQVNGEDLSILKNPDVVEIDGVEYIEKSTYDLLWSTYNKLFAKVLKLKSELEVLLSVINPIDQYDDIMNSYKSLLNRHSELILKYEEALKLLEEYVSLVNDLEEPKSYLDFSGEIFTGYSNYGFYVYANVEWLPLWIDPMKLGLHVVGGYTPQGRGLYYGGGISIRFSVY